MLADTPCSGRFREEDTEANDQMRAFGGSRHDTAARMDATATSRSNGSAVGVAERDRQRMDGRTGVAKAPSIGETDLFIDATLTEGRNMSVAAIVAVRKVPPESRGRQTDSDVRTHRQPPACAPSSLAPLLPDPSKKLVVRLGRVGG